MAETTDLRSWMSRVLNDKDNQGGMDRAVGMTTPEARTTPAPYTTGLNQYPAPQVSPQGPKQREMDNVTFRSTRPLLPASVPHGMPTASHGSWTSPNMSPVLALNEQRQLDNGDPMEIDEKPRAKRKATDIDYQSGDMNEPMAKRPSPPRGADSVGSEALRGSSFYSSAENSFKRFHPDHGHRGMCSCGQIDHSGSSRRWTM